MYWVMYLRKSRADMEKERYGKYETLAIHEAELVKLADREGIVIGDIYKELASGETVEKRPEFQKVMDRIADPDCEGIVVHAVDRLGRGDPLEYGWILSMLRYTGARIMTPGRVYDPSDADDMQQLKMQMFVSNMEFDHIRQRLQRGSYASAERGSYIGSIRPYGYDRAYVNRVHTLVPNAEAGVVREMYALACEGWNKGAIARKLNADGIPTMRGKIWSAQRVSAVLSNPVYKGWIRYGYVKHRVVGMDGMKPVKKRIAGQGDYVLAKGVHEALVSEEDWEKANRLAFEAVPVKRDRAIKNPLAGLIVCAGCGRALIRQDVVGAHGGHYPRLHHAYNTECQCKSISVAYVMGKVLDALKEVAEDSSMASEPPDRSGEADALRTALAKEDGRLDRLIELYEADAITIGEFKERRDASRESAARIKARLDEIEAESMRGEVISDTVPKVIEMLEDPDVSEEMKNTALKSIVSQIRYRELDTARKDRAIELEIDFR
jgi:DNA invertase Pin-like site-specific DNA recombinase